LAHLFRPAIVNKSSTEHHSASGLFPWQDKKSAANPENFILSVIPKECE